MSAAETVATEGSDTQSKDEDVSVSEESESEDELLLEFGDASNSGENDSKDSKSEEEDQLPKGARVNRCGRKVGNWRLRYRPLSRNAETKDFARLTSHPVRA